MDSFLSSGMSGVVIAQLTNLLMTLIPQGLVLIGAFLWFQKTKNGWGIALIFAAVMTTLLTIGNTFLTVGYIYRLSYSEIDVLNALRIILSTAHFFNGLLFGTAFLMMVLRTTKKSS